MADEQQQAAVTYYCPECNREAPRPLVCRDCLSVICPECGTPLEDSRELGIG